MADEVPLLHLIERIYDAAADPSALQHVAPMIAKEFGAEGGWLYTVMRPGAINQELLSATANFDDWAHTSYTNYFRKRDCLSAAAVRKAMPLLTTNNDLEIEQAFERTEVYQDYFRKLGFFHFLTGMFPLRDELLGSIALHRPHQAKHFEPHDRKRLGLLVPHLQRVVQIHQRLSAGDRDRALNQEILSRLALGVILVAHDMRIVFANEIAYRLMRGGQSLIGQRGMLALRGRNHAAFDKLVREAAATSAGKGASAGGIVSVPLAGGARLPLLVSPFRSDGSYGVAAPAALIIFADPESQTEVPEDVLARMFGLAPAEARLLSALVKGDTIADYAECAGVTLNTAKTQMRQIFLKTGYNRQSDVIRAALANPLVAFASTDSVTAPPEIPEAAE